MSKETRVRLQSGLYVHACWCLRRAISVDISSSRSEERLLMLLFTAPVIVL